MASGIIYSGAAATSLSVSYSPASLAKVNIKGHGSNMSLYVNGVSMPPSWNYYPATYYAYDITIWVAPGQTIIVTAASNVTSANFLISSLEE